MKFDFQRFHPQPLPSGVAFVAIVLFVALGVWQLARAEEKRALGDLLTRQHALPELDLNRDAPDSEQLYRRVTARGRFATEHTILLDNRTYEGRRGYHVIVPFRPAGRRLYLLVNRGWTASPDEVPVPHDEVVIHGELRRVSGPALQLEFDPDQGQAPPVWPYLTLERFRGWSKLECYPLQLLETGESAAYVRNWPPIRTDPGMHTGYAIQWFAFAAIALAIWTRLSMTRESESI